MTVLYKDKNYRTSVRGVDNGYFKVQNWNLKEGREFAKSELRTGQNVCILGQTVIKELALSDVRRGIQMFGHVAAEHSIHGRKAIAETVDYVRKGRKNNFDKG